MEIQLKGASAFRDRPASWLTAVCLLACIALAACQPQTNVSATGNVPAQYQHVWVTVHDVAFNTSATAGLQDSTWQQYALPTPETFDLATLTNGALAQFASALKLPEGTYNQVRITLTDASESLTSGAQAAGATFNDEVDYTDAGGTLHRLPLQVPNAAQGIAFPVNLTVASSQQAGLAALACAVTSSNGSLANTGALAGGTGGFGNFGSCAFGGQTKADCVSGQFFDSLLGSCITVGGTSTFGTTNPSFASTSGCAAGTTFNAATGSCVSSVGTTPFGTTGSSCAAGTSFNSATGACVATNAVNFASSCSVGQTYNPRTGTCSSSLSASTTSLAIDFDAARDLAPYLLGGQPGFVLIPHIAALNTARAGSIAGSVNVSALPAGTGGIEVTAETLSSDGSRHVIVKSAPLSSTGSFVLYPLPATTSAASSSSSTTCPAGETYNSASGTCVTTASTTEQFDLVIHGPGIATVIITGVPVTAGGPASAGSLSFGVTLTPAISFPVQLAAGNVVAPAGAYVGFYQTIPTSGEVPYLIEAYPVDPFTGTFDSAQLLSDGELQYAAYVTGSAVALTVTTPAEGAGSYHIAASAPLYGDGPLSTTVVAPASVTTPAAFTVASIPLPSGTTASSISGTVTVATPGKYDRGELVLTQNGALLAAAPLDSYLGAAQSSATFFGSVPGSSAGSVSNKNQFSAEAWVWSSSNPSGTLSRQPVASVIDLSSGNASGITIAIE